MGVGVPRMAQLISDLGGPVRVEQLLFAHDYVPIPSRTLIHWAGAGGAGASAKGFCTLLLLARELSPELDPWTYIVEAPEGK